MLKEPSFAIPQTSCYGHDKQFSRFSHECDLCC